MNDTRLFRMTKEYEALRNTEDKIMSGLDDVLPAMALAIETNRKGIESNSEAIESNSRMLQAIIEHLDAPYEEKPPMGFRTS